jgi:hypothetical protein
MAVRPQARTGSAGQQPGSPHGYTLQGNELLRAVDKGLQIRDGAQRLYAGTETSSSRSSSSRDPLLAYSGLPVCILLPPAIFFRVMRDLRLPHPPSRWIGSLSTIYPAAARSSSGNGASMVATTRATNRCSGHRPSNSSYGMGHAPHLHRLLHSNNT